MGTEQRRASRAACRTLSMPAAACVSALLICCVATSASDPAGSIFDGSSLAGWSSEGAAQWRVEQGQIVGSVGNSGNGGWLRLDHQYQDVLLNLAFECHDCETGVLLRSGPSNWSRYSHPVAANKRSTGTYIELSGQHPGNIYQLTLDDSGKEAGRRLIQSAPTEQPDEAAPVIDSACPPIPCAGINHAQASPKGWPPEPVAAIEKGSDGWQHAQITLRGVVGSADANQYGALALHVSGKPGSEVRFKDISLIDLTQRSAAFAPEVTDKQFRRQQLTDLFYAEGIAAGDLNRDGVQDVVVGPFYYLGPDFRVAREIYSPATINPAGPKELGNYSNCFLTYVYDFNGDGWPDVLMIMGFGPKPDFSAHLFINPHGESRHWDNYNVVPVISAETTQLVDLDRDGHPELIMSQGGQIGYAKPDWHDVTKPWTFHPVSTKAVWGPHGFGVGDVNGDGRLDILQASGWWEQPASSAAGLWKFHRAAFGGAGSADIFMRGGADMFVYDVNGDGLPDVITSLEAHGPGLAWFEQVRDPQGAISWKRHLIMGDPNTPADERQAWEETDKNVAFTELHALALADMDGDGIPDIVTGKRWWSHGYRPEETDFDAPPALYWFKLVRTSGGKVEFVPHLINSNSGVGTQIEATDMNGDGVPDVLTSTRKGAFVFFNLASPHATHDARLKPWTTWRDYLGGPDSSHYSALSQINASNVSKLSVAWTYPTGDDVPYGFNPIVIDNTMYVMAKNTSVVALNAATGRELWVYHPNVPNDYWGEMHRGINYWESADRSYRRLLITFNQHLEAIDARTGKLITSFGKNGLVDLREGLGRDPKSIVQIQSGTPGRVFGNLIILGSATGEDYMSPPGDIRAFDVRTGRMVWIFHTVPHPGEYGYDTWPKDAWKYVGGTNAWGELTLDEKRGIIYAPLGAPTYDFYGADRKGANLFADCLIALDARTGKRLWHYQFIHHDLWDYDPTAAPQLLTVQHDGKTVDVVAQATKQGFLYVFDRVTGQPLWPIEERPTPQANTPGEQSWPTQPFPTKPTPFARQKFTADDVYVPLLDPIDQRKMKQTIDSARNEGLYTPPGMKDVIEMPGNHGGANWGSTAADPTNGTMFIVSMDLPAILKLVHKSPPSLWDLPTVGTPAELGRALYEDYCQMCHGPDRKGAPPAIPSLVHVTDRLSGDAIKSIVLHGRRDMPAFSDVTPTYFNGLLTYLANPALAPNPAKLAVSSAPPKYPDGTVGAPVRYWSGYGMQPAIIRPPWSTLTAYDLNEGTIKWQVPLGNAPQGASLGLKNTGVMMPRNGPVVTAGGIIFVATKDEGKLHAYDERTGKEIWQTDLPAASEGVPAVYEVNGREFLVICATSPKASTVPVDGPTDAGNGPVNRTYIAFALPSGTTSETAALAK